MDPKLPHLPLWPGVAYRITLLPSNVVIPSRLILASARQFPRTHSFEDLEHGCEIKVVERSSGVFFLDDAPVRLQFA